MSTMAHTLALFGGVFAILVVASVVGFVLERRYATAGVNPRSRTSTAASRPGG